MTTGSLFKSYAELSPTMQTYLAKQAVRELGSTMFGATDVAHKSSQIYEELIDAGRVTPQGNILSCYAGWIGHVSHLLQDKPQGMALVFNAAFIVLDRGQLVEITPVDDDSIDAPHATYDIERDGTLLDVFAWKDDRWANCSSQYTVAAVLAPQFVQLRLKSQKFV